MTTPITYRLKHIGINCANEAEARKLVPLLCCLFNLHKGSENASRIFVGSVFEVFKEPRRGAHGHIALQTEDVEAAMADLADKGVTFDQDSIRRRADGKISVVYLEGEIGGFSFHLTE